MQTSEERIRAFKIDLEKIEIQNIDYFLFERPAMSDGTRDRLEYHWKFEMRGDKPMFGFNLTSTIPQHIRNKCFASFSKHFLNGGIIGGFFRS